MCIYNLPIPILNVSIILHMARIASAIMILFQICSVHYLPHGDTADFDFEENSSLLSENEGEDKN